MLTVQKISSFAEFKNYRHDWEDLLSRSHADNIFLTYEWIEACIGHFCRGKKLLVLEIFEGEKLVGIAPMMIYRRRYFGPAIRLVCFIGANASDRMDFIIDADSNREEIVAGILDYIVGVQDEWDFIDLQDIDKDTGTIDSIERYLSAKSFTGIIGPEKKSFFISMNGNAGLIFNRFSKKFCRKQNKINNKWFGANIEFERYIGSNLTENQALFSELRYVANRSWQSEKHSGIFSRTEAPNFHTIIFNRFREERLLDVAIMRLNKKPIAYIYNYLYNGRLYNYSIAFDKRYSGLSPGTLLMLWSIMDSAAKGIREYDFTRGEEAWKKRLTNDFKIHNRVRIFKNGFYSRCLYLLQSKVIPAINGNNNIRRAYTRLKKILRWI